MTLSRRHHDSPPDAHFAATRWTVVCAAGAQDPATVDKALHELCSAYWYPLYAFVRRSGHTREEAENLTQEFFAQLLAKDFPAHVEPKKRRFRSFLLTAMKRFLANDWHRTTAKKPEGGEMPVPIDIAWAEDRYGAEPADPAAPELLYERRWALTLNDKVLDGLEHEYVEKGLDAIYHALKGELVRHAGAMSYTEIATQLEMREGAVKVAMYRLRGRYAERLSDEIAQTVNAPEDVEDEIRRLVQISER